MRVGGPPPFPLWFPSPYLPTRLFLSDKKRKEKKRKKKRERRGIYGVNISKTRRFSRHLATRGKRSAREAGVRGGGKRGQKQEGGGWRSKKDRSARASLVDGGNGSLGIALSISGPLGPSTTPSPPLRPLYRRLHSIPFSTPSQR